MGENLTYLILFWTSNIVFPLTFSCNQCSILKGIMQCLCVNSIIKVNKCQLSNVFPGTATLITAGWKLLFSYFSCLIKVFCPHNYKHEKAFKSKRAKYTATDFLNWFIMDVEQIFDDDFVQLMNLSVHRARVSKGLWVCKRNYTPYLTLFYSRAPFRNPDIFHEFDKFFSSK